MVIRSDKISDIIVTHMYREIEYESERKVRKSTFEEQEKDMKESLEIPLKYTQSWGV